MATGTFTVIATSNPAGGTPYTNDGTGNPAGYSNSNVHPTLFDALYGASPLLIIRHTLIDILRFSCSGNCISIDGGPNIDYNSLPAGFKPTSAVLSAVFSFGSGGDYFLQLAQSTEGSANTSTLSYDFSVFPTPTMLVIISNGFGIRFDLTSEAFGLTGLVIDGDYTTDSFSYNLPVPSHPVQTGSSITVTSNPSDTSPMDFTQIETITVNYTDSNGNPQSIAVSNIATQTINELIFDLPDITADSPGSILIEITSTQFSGTVILGKLITIYFINAPGIYQLTPGQYFDTVYDIENGGTVDVAIPDPSWKTGFVGG